MNEQTPWFNTPQTFGRISIVLHWSTAWIFLTALVLGWWMEDFELIETWLTETHYLVGLSILFLGLIRIINLGLQVQPNLLGQPSIWQKRLKTWVQIGLVACLVLLPVSGFLMMYWQNEPFEIYGLSLPQGIASESLSELFEEVHELLVNIALILIGLHVLAAIKHHWFDMDDTLNRMRGRTVK